MNRLLRRLLTAAAGASFAAICSPGCAASQSVIFIRQVQARVAQGTGGCTADNNPSSLSITAGTMDVAFRSEYHATLLVGSQLVGRGRSAQLRTETARVAIQGAVVHLTDAAGAVVWGPTTVPGSGFIDPGAGEDPSYGITDTVLLGATYGQQLRDELSANPALLRRFVATAKVFGETLGGTAVESGEWEFPINVCYGCLVAFPSDANDPKSATQPNCDLAASTGNGPGNPCNLGQDDGVDCRLCKQATGGSAICSPI
jgi:hypothetical protein